jgi:arabinofuranosyltransferase
MIAQERERTAREGDRPAPLEARPRAERPAPAGAVRARPRPASALDRGWAVLCAAGFLVLCALQHRYVADDAWITIRYAENLASGAGFVFNPGGPRVEGYSNPLLVSLEALGVTAGISALTVTRALGVASGLALIALLHVAAPAVAGRSATRVAIALTALFPPMALWAVGGLETLPTALAVTAGALALARRDALRAGAAFAVLPWLRPEGLAVALAVAVAAEALPLLRGPARSTALRRLALAAGLPLLSQAALEALRLGIYGHLLPNSVLYKSGNGELFEVLLQFAERTWPVLIVGGVGMLLARGRARLLAVPPLVYAVGSLNMMDSANAFARFLLPTWPQWALLAGIAAAALGRRPAIVAAVALAAAAIHTGHESLHYSRAYDRCKTAAREDAAAWLRTATPPDTVFSISDAGLVPARAQRTVVDQLLLNEAIIQRTGAQPVSGGAAYTYAHKPDVLLLASTDRDRFQGRYAVDRAIAGDPRFAGYRLAHVATAGCGYSLFAFRS